MTTKEIDVSEELYLQIKVRRLAAAFEVLPQRREQMVNQAMLSKSINHPKRLNGNWGSIIIGSYWESLAFVLFPGKTYRSHIGAIIGPNLESFQYKIPSRKSSVDWDKTCWRLISGLLCLGFETSALESDFGMFLSAHEKMEIVQSFNERLDVSLLPDTTIQWRRRHVKLTDERHPYFGHFAVKWDFSTF